MSKHSKNIMKAIIHTLCWAIGGWLAYTLMSVSEAKDAYAAIVGWWLALYVGYVASIRIKAALPVIGLYVGVCIVSFLFGNTWFYHGAPSTFSFAFLITIIIQGVFFASPIFVNEFTRWVVKRKLETAL